MQGGLSVHDRQAGGHVSSLGDRRGGLGKALDFAGGRQYRLPEIMSNLHDNKSPCHQCELRSSVEMDG